tara:strand:+ start:1502 stop:1609 length:108 start_codon:yes stop_codon:yes gene_type:complete
MIVYVTEKYIEVNEVVTNGATCRELVIKNITRAIK